MGETLLSLLSARWKTEATRKRRGLMAAVAMLAVSIGVYSVATTSPALAVTPDLTAPERVYTAISQEIAFTNVVDPISDDNRTIAVTVSPGPICDTDPAAGPVILNGCSRVQMDLNTNGSGLLFIPGSHTVTNANTNNTKTIVAASGAIIDQATDSDGGPSLVYHISGNENQINDTLSALKFQPTPGYETLAIQPTILHVVAINGQNAAVTSKNIEIKVEGGNGAPTISVPNAPVDAPVGTGQQNDSGTAFPADPSNPATPALATVVDPEMCNLTICGQPYTNPGGVEDDDATLLIAWVDPNCGDFHFRGGSFPVHGGVLNTTVLALLTNVDTGQNPGLNLAGEQAAPILNAIGLQAQTVDLQLQPTDVTSFTTAFAGVGSLDDVRYTLSQITYRGPTDDKTCPLHLAVSDLGNSGMPAPHGYVGSPIGGADQPQPGYEIPDAKADVQDITFAVHDTHPDVTIEQTTPGLAGDPTNQPVKFTAHFSEAMQSLTANDLLLGGPATVGNTVVTPAGSATDYTITVTPSSDGAVTASLNAGSVFAAGQQGNAQRSNDASTSTDNSVTFDGTKPTATLTASAVQVGSPVLMTVSFNEPINPAGFTGANVTLVSSDSLTAIVTPLTSTSFQIAVTGMLTTPTITATVNAAAVKDLAGNDSNVSNQVVIGWTNGAPGDSIKPDVTIDQAVAQVDPTSASPVVFTAVFSEPVLGFTGSDVSLSGPAATGATASITGAGPTYTVSVSGMTQSGALVAIIAAGAVTDLSLNPSNASTSTDNSVTYNKPGAATHFSVSAPASAQRNVAFNVTVTALDAGNATVAGYGGIVHITSSDAGATLPSNATLLNGVGTFSVTLTNPVDGNYAVTATDTVAAGINGTSGSVALSALAPAVATHLGVTSNASVIAGNVLSVTVTALSASNAPTTNYSGTVHFTSSDGAAVLPADSTLLNGTKVFSVTLKSSGNRVLTATDTITPSITGAVVGGVTVQPAAVTHFTTTAPPSSASGAPFTLTVTAKDSYNNTATTYAGTVHFTSSDGAATLPANSTLISGTKSFSVTLATAGGKTVTATDTITPSINGFSNVSVSAPAAATHLAVTTVGSMTAGNSVSVTVTALTAGNAPATTYAGTVHFTSSDGQAVLPVNSTLVNGTKTFSVTLKTSGNMTVTATDTVTASINGTTGTVAVASSAATHLTVAVPAATTTNFGFTAVVTAFDAFNNVATSYAGGVAITASGGAPILPANATLTNGVGLFSVTFTVPGSFTVTATDSVTFAITGTSTPTVVSSTPQPAATGFAIAVPGSAAAGTPFNVTVTATAGNVPTSNYAGTLTLTSTSTGTLPASVALINGVGVFSVTLQQAGSPTVTATDTVSVGITGTSAAVAVAAGAATHFTVSAPATAVMNIPVSVIVSALDSFGNQATGYGGTVHFTSTDPAAVLPLDAGLAGGVGSFQATMKTAGSRTITATDTVTASINGTTNSVTVAVPAPATHFAVTTNASSAAGSALSVTVTALDASNLATTNYVGSVSFSSSDGAAVLPPNLVLINGTGTAAATLKTAGVQTITVTDTVTPSKNGVTGNITVTPGAATHLTLTGPASASNGFTVSILVTAKDQFGNTATGYSGTVHLTSTDGAATVGANSTLTGGTKVFSASFVTNGNQTVTATDTVTASINGTTGLIAVSGLPPTPASHFSVTAAGSSTAGNSVSVTVTALDAANAATAGYSGIVHITASDGAGTLPADATLLNGVGIFPVTLRTAGNQTVTATDTVTASINGVSGVVVVAASTATHLGVVAPAAATSGAPISAVVTALDQFGNRDTGYPGAVHVTSSDSAAVLPSNNTLLNGIGTFPVTLNTLGSATVTATDTVTNSIAGTSGAVNVTNAPPGVATHFSVSAPSSASAGSAFSVTVMALSATNATASAYSGTVHFTSNAAGTLPADVALVNGVAVVSATLTTSGSHTITATDTTSPITGTSSAIDVAAAAAAQLQLSVPVFIQVTAFNSVSRQIEVVGSQYSFTVKALDQYGNVATSYAGIVHFVSDDPTAILPPDSPLTNGVGTFTVVFGRKGTSNLSVVDLAAPGIAGATVGGIAVGSAGTPGVPDPGALPATGSNSTPSLWIACLMILAGIGALVGRSRRRRGTPAR